MIRAHSLIEDLEKHKSFYAGHGMEAHKVDAIIKLIKNSFKFKFGGYNALIDMFSVKSLSNRYIFTGENAKRLHFPYELCLFEYEGWPGEFYCVLVLYSHKKRQFTACIFFKGKNSARIWMLQPLAVEMGIGENLEGQTSNINLVKCWNKKRDLQDYEDKEIDHILRGPLQFLEMALRLFSCSNVGIAYTDPPEKLQKKRAKGGKKPLFRYHTLILKPVGKRQKSLAAQGLWNQAISTTKGHDRHCPPPGLFGKYPGTFWIQPYTRGKKKEGIVHKEYDTRELSTKKKAY